MRLETVRSLREKLRLHEHISYTVIFKLENIVNVFKEKGSYVTGSGIKTDEIPIEIC